MNIKFSHLGVGVVLVVTACSIKPNFHSGSFTLRNLAKEECIKINTSPEDTAEELIKSQNGCIITGDGVFNGEAFIHVKCNSDQEHLQQQYIFGSRESCNAFKELTNVEYIKVILQNMLPPKK